MRQHIAIYGQDLDPKWENKLNILIDSLLSHPDVSLCFYKGLKDSDDSFSSHSDLPSDISLFLALGGDGTFLNSLTFVRDRNIPVAGINFGRLGFLTTARVLEDNPNQWISSLVNSRFKIDPRPILNIVSENLPEEFYPFALNEISIQRGDPYMISIDLKVNGMEIPTYWADGLLIATSTGSTAYSLSVGGPIVAPGSNVFIIAPVAPHNLNVRPIIVPSDSQMEILIHSKYHPAVVSVDNRSFTINGEKPIRLSLADFKMQFVSFTDSNFFQALHEKLLWGEDKRNNS